MKHITDMLVVGSGIIGASIAFALTETARHRVTLLEKGPLVSGMTRRSAGLVHPFHAHPLLAELAVASYPFYAQSAAQLVTRSNPRANKNAFVETGAALLSAGGADTAKIFARAQMLAPLSREIAPSARGALAAIYPGVSEKIQGGLFTPRAGYADAVQMTQNITAVAQERGLHVATGTFVKQIIVSGGRVKSVITTTGEIQTPLVILATGAWTEKLLTPLHHALGLQFRGGAILFFEQPETLTQGHPLFLDVNGEYFLRAHPYRLSAAGYVANPIENANADALDEYVSPASSARVAQFAAACLPNLNMTPKRGHTILYDTLADGLPALGSVPDAEGLYVAAGFGASAFSVAPAVGETIAQLVIDGSATRDVSSFHPFRKTSRSYAN